MTGTRAYTPTVHHPDGSHTITMKRYCNGCDQPLGDATDAEIDAAIEGRELPDVQGECSNCTPAAEGPR